MKFLILFFIVTVGLFQSSVAMAAEGLVTCTGGDDCNFCSFVEMANGLIEWLIIIATLLTVLLLAFSGFRLVTSGGDAAALEQAKKMFVSCIIGIMIMLAGWTIVDTVLKIAAGGDLGVWNAVECGGAYEVAPADALAIALETHEGVTIDRDGEGDVTGFFFRAYTFNSANSCKQLSTTNLPTMEMCRSALADVTSSGQSYVVQNCDRQAVSGSLPNWSSAAECGIPTSPAGQICYRGSGSGQVCFNAFEAVEIVGSVPGYNYPSGYSYLPHRFIDTRNPGPGVSMNTKVSPRYTLADLNVSNTCGDGGRFMYISPRALIGLENTLDYLGVDTSLNSAFRSPGCNVNVSGASHSRHMGGIAFDIRIPQGMSKQQLYNACIANGAGFAMTYDSTNHVHCDWR